ncbi:MAG: TraX family protein [Pseudomonadota bacterium]
MSRSSNYQDILKTIAIFTMILDHLGAYIFPETLVLRSIGRYAFPIFCFFAGFNYKGSLNYKILIYGVLFYIFEVAAIFWQITEANILISIFLGQAYIKLFEKHFTNFWKSYTHIIILACLWPVTNMFIEYGTLAIALMILGKLARQDQQKVFLPACVVSYLSLIHMVALYYSLFNIWEMLIAVLIMLGLFFSLTLKNYFKANNLKLVLISQNSMNIYCFHFAIILLIWRYYIFG